MVVVVEAGVTKDMDKATIRVMEVTIRVMEVGMVTRATKAMVMTRVAMDMVVVGVAMTRVAMDMVVMGAMAMVDIQVSGDKF